MALRSGFLLIILLLASGCASLTSGFHPGLDSGKSRKIASLEDPASACSMQAKTAVLEAGYALRNLDSTVPGMAAEQGNATYFLPLLRTLRTDSLDKVAAVHLRLADCEVEKIDFFTRDGRE